MIRALELYCGIGGFASRANSYGIDVVAAIDASSHVVQTYNRNFDQVAVQKNVLQLSASDLQAYGADLWWMSPPCAPFTRRGKQLDLEDHRTRSYLRVVDAIEEIRPRFVAMENVERFAKSAARDRILDALAGYDVVERVLCPTEFGWPNKRPRYYLVAGRDAAIVAPAEPRYIARWQDFVDPEVHQDYIVPQDIVDRYGAQFHIVDDDATYTTCFTGSYGKSWNFTGSYLRRTDGTLRRFTPREVLRFLGFGDSFTFPDDFDDRQRYKYAGNSLSRATLDFVLAMLGTHTNHPTQSPP